MADEDVDLLDEDVEQAAPAPSPKATPTPMTDGESPGHRPESGPWSTTDIRPGR
jgi:hypothetical protein